WLALLNEAHDVFDYDNGVIDNKTSRNRQRHEREVVEAVTAQPHHAAGARERERHRNTGDERRPKPAQEQKHHHHDERHRDEERYLNVADGGANRYRSIAHYVEMHTRRQPGPQLRQDAMNQIGGSNNVGVWLFEND